MPGLVRHYAGQLVGIVDMIEQPSHDDHAPARQCDRVDDLAVDNHEPHRLGYLRLPREPRLELFERVLSVGAAAYAMPADDDRLDHIAKPRFRATRNERR